MRWRTGVSWKSRKTRCASASVTSRSVGGSTREDGVKDARDVQVCCYVMAMIGTAENRRVCKPKKQVEVLCSRQ